MGPVITISGYTSFTAVHHVPAGHPFDSRDSFSSYVLSILGRVSSYEELDIIPPPSQSKDTLHPDTGKLEGVSSTLSTD